MAESIGIEPTHRFHDDGLAIRCITTLPTLHLTETFCILLVFFEKVNIFFYIGSFFVFLLLFIDNPIF